jgi:hypothetical protein
VLFPFLCRSSVESPFSLSFNGIDDILALATALASNTALTTLEFVLGLFDFVGVDVDVLHESK